MSSFDFPSHHYVPCLRWKQGEYKAVATLSDAAKELITPLIEVPEKGYDFETGTYRKTIDEHLAVVPRRLATKWQDRPCFVDLKLIPPLDRLRGGVHPITFLFDEFDRLGCSAIPVVGLDRDPQYRDAVSRCVLKRKRGLCVRIDLEQASSPNFATSITSILGQVPIEESHLVLDLGAPNFIPLEGFSILLQAVIKRVPRLQRWRTFSLIGTSFPASMAEVSASQGTIPRNEWLLYKLLACALIKRDTRIPSFGDYVINHPHVLTMDMRFVKPSGTIRYAVDDAWFIVKGPNVRDNGFRQYVDHCNAVVSSPHYSGAAFSKGDEYIANCAAGIAGTGNLSTWRWIGTNHHLEKVARDVANFAAV